LPDSTPTGSLATALAHTRRLLAARPDLAEQQAREILKVVPASVDAKFLLAAARRLQGDAKSARELLEPLAAANPRSAETQFELAQALADLGDTRAAIAALRRTVANDPAFANGWLALGDQLTLLGDTAGADAAYAKHVESSTKNPQLLAAAAALYDNRLAIAERLLRDYLKVHPTDVAAIRMLAEVASRLSRYGDAEALLSRALELSPSFATARHNYASVLYRENKVPEALREVETLLAKDPRNPSYRGLQAAVLGQAGEYERAIAVYEELLAQHPDHPKTWMSFGHSLKSLGRTAQGIDAYRRSIALLPTLGEAWWSLANLKTFRFTPDEIGAMRSALKQDKLSDEDRFHLHFALGKALEDAGQYDEAFAQYEQGNAQRKQTIQYSAEETSDHLRRSKALYTREFFDSRKGQGSTAPDPIFIVGLPRAGSTLVEQILASHSAVEGTMELPDIIGIARRLGGRKKRSEDTAYPEIVAELSAGELRALGEEFLARTRIQRKLGRPFFIDKMPNNFAHTGLIHLILPNAKIVDARRHPLGCCFSGYKQHFARGQNFSYALSDIGRYYADYVALMAHFDEVLPGRVHRVIYEDLVADPEREVRRLLAYCGLPFEASCLKFYENDRAVRTASSEQVRMPIFTDAVEHWRNFEPWLGPLKDALGPVLQAYPAVPTF
jgi:tetratricopeptide (TPR) repeat protein